MTVELRPATDSDRDTFAGFIATAAGLAAYETVALDDLIDHAFGPDAFVKVVMAEAEAKTVGVMAYYMGFGDGGLTVNVIFLHIVEDWRLGPAFLHMIDFVRRLAGKRGAVSVNFAGAIFDERTCGMLQSVKREARSRTLKARRP